MLTVDTRCMCHKCKARSGNIYRMIGVCSNCGTDPILLLYRVGDKTGRERCPVCQCSEVRATRLATPDEITEAP